MSSRRILVFLGAAAAWAALAAAGIAGPAGGGPTPPAKERKPLVRLDLLRLTPPALAPERRNIFVAGASAVTAPSAENEETDSEAENPVLGSGEAAAPGEAFSLQYVGYIHSPRGVIGLVLVEGAAQAVAQGEPVQPGYTATRVTVKEIEVTGPDGKARIYPLQGVEE
jgi:hypothetical protein